MPSACGESKPLLLVEDDDTGREALALLLTSAGYLVATATNGQEALDQLRSGQSPRLILLDLMMPVMDGWRFRREQQHDPKLASIPVVLLSATVDLPREAASLGVAAYLQKPIDIDQLLSTIGRYR